ncbi:hypothetical protein [Streptomyces sp. NBC_00154]|uniref:hypothetical protein n=1 Tax=Streptomyces sp. NBC_00154 TaxID=2975670 RepID=UPI00225A8C58|nr:hypothetical protein [Streptomyces sp. NBC_00154]MCX5318020.1 hypothetical protein [Streptomyces sp. NBC_00154]
MKTLLLAAADAQLDQAETRAQDARVHAAGADPDGEELPAKELAPALSEDLLRACLPALCLPELAELPNPQVTARRTLHHIAHRVHNNPRLADLAADRLHAAADALVPSTLKPTDGSPLLVRCPKGQRTSQAS